MRLLDISQRVGTATAVWPGDHEVQLSWTMSCAAGHSVNVAALALSTHTGTHVDGFHHVRNDGARIGAMPLDAYVGPGTVVDARGAVAIGPAHVADVDLRTTKRVLFRTRDHVDEQTFPETLAPITPSLATLLVEAGVRLVGTDAPSIDPIDSKTLDAHHILAAGGVANLENAVLTDVAPGDYILIALPLRLMEADSSPVRAVLIAGGWNSPERSGPEAARPESRTGAAGGWNSPERSGPEAARPESRDDEAGGGRD
jgi:arylformamidase